MNMFEPNEEDRFSVKQVVTNAWTVVKSSKPIDWTLKDKSKENDTAADKADE